MIGFNKPIEGAKTHVVYPLQGQVVPRGEW